MKSPHTGISRIIHAFIYSYNGFKSTLQSEAAFRQDLAIFIIGTLITLFLPFGVLAKGLMISALILILLMELINTAIETVIDRISPDYHEFSKKAKDIGSLLVLISFLNAFVIWISIFIQFSK